MKKKKSSRVSIRDIARAAGISKAATSYALQNKPEVSRATRERVLRIAKRLGYAPDARMAVVMTGVRGAKAKDLLPIVWLNTEWEEDAWHKYKYLSPYLEGARDRALQFGYRIEEIWSRRPGMTMHRISQILYQRGIEGVLVTYPAKRIRLKWDHLACVALGGALQAPRFHRVTTDYFYNFLLVVKILKRAGYQHIGVCLEKNINVLTYQGISAMTRYSDVMYPKSTRVPPFFYSGEGEENWGAVKKQIIAWMRRHKPDVIVCHSNRLVECVVEAGYRVPEDIGVVHLATDDDISDWAGIFSNRKAIGAAAAEWVISLIQNRQFGVPKPNLNTTIQGTWHPGRTLLIPKPK